jgi:hypothetical protein
MSFPAARLADLTATGDAITGPGAPMSGALGGPAARPGHQHGDGGQSRHRGSGFYGCGPTRRSNRADRRLISMRLDKRLNVQSREQNRMSGEGAR